MKIRFLGPLDRVTGSCSWLVDEAAGVQFLVDCGTMQSEPGEREWNSGAFPFDPSALDFVLLTHPHQDHYGLIPRLVEAGFSGPVYCTHETAEITRIGLEDAARFRDARFSEETIPRIRFVTPSGGKFNEPHDVGKGIAVRMYRTGHTLGAVSFRVRWECGGQGKTVTFSGDIGSAPAGREHMPIIGHSLVPTPAHFAVVESTYGDATRDPSEKDFEARLERLTAVIDRATLERSGVLVIPSFATERAQNLLYDISVIYARNPKKYLDVPVYLDAPMASKINKVYAQRIDSHHAYEPGGDACGWFNRRLPDWLGTGSFDEVMAGLKAVLSRGRKHSNHDDDPVEYPERIHQVIGSDNEESFRNMRHALMQGDRPAIVLTSSGMCEGGRVLSYLERLLPLEKTTILFPGYVSRRALGGRILEFADIPFEERRSLDGELEWDVQPNGSCGHRVRMPRRAVKAHIERIGGYSGHADQSDLLDWVFRRDDLMPLVAPHLFLVHGSTGSRHALRDAITARAATRHDAAGNIEPLRVDLPTDPDRWFDLDQGEWE